MTMVKNAPRNVTNAIDISLVGQKMSEAGTHASGGIGRRISNTGKKKLAEVAVDRKREAERDADELREGEADQHALEAQVPALPVPRLGQHRRPRHRDVRRRRDEGR